jgi:hypothetical protein
MPRLNRRTAILQMGGTKTSTKIRLARRECEKHLLRHSKGHHRWDSALRYSADNELSSKAYDWSPRCFVSVLHENRPNECQVNIIASKADRYFGEAQSASSLSARHLSALLVQSSPAVDGDRGRAPVRRYVAYPRRVRY